MSVQLRSSKGFHSRLELCAAEAELQQPMAGPEEPGGGAGRARSYAPEPLGMRAGGRPGRARPGPAPLGGDGGGDGGGGEKSGGGAARGRRRPHPPAAAAAAASRAAPQCRMLQEAAAVSLAAAGGGVATAEAPAGGIKWRISRS